MNWSKVTLYLFWSENLFDIWWMYVIRGLMQHPYINIQTWPSLTSHKQTTKLVLVWSQIYITNFKPLLLPEIVQKPGKAKLRTLPKFNYTYELTQNKSLMLWTQNLSSTQHYTEWNVLLARFKIIMNSETKEVIYDANNKQKVVELLHDFNQQSLKIWESVMSQYLKTHQFYVHLFEYLHKDLSN